MIQIPHRLQGPWSNIGYLLIAHILQKPPVRERLDIAWIAKQLSITVEQLTTMLHRDNKQPDIWFHEMLQRLREMGYPEMVVFEHNGVMHYTVAEALIYKMEVVDKNSGYSWTTSND
jgi:hypothetical protein